MGLFRCFFFLIFIYFYYLTGFQKGDIRPFLVEGEQVGLIKADVVKQLQRYPEIFCIRNCEFTKQVKQSGVKYKKKMRLVIKILH